MVWSDRESYAAGDAATFYAQSNEDCYLTLVNVDRAGRATVLFPNEFEQNNLLPSNRETRIPATDSPYRFRFKEKGRETLVGICTRNQRMPEGIRHDFDRLRFTVLGDWQLFLKDQPSIEDARRDDAASERPRPTPKRGRAKEEPRVDRRVVVPDVQTRTAITFDVN